MLKKILGTLSILGFFVSIGMMIGLAGSLENDVIDFKEYAIKTVISVTILLLSVIGLRYTDDDESEYKNL